MRERESCAPESLWWNEKKRGMWVSYREKREKIIKILNTQGRVYIYTQVYTHWCGCFFSQNV